jgi:hypothetical protein
MDEEKQTSQTDDSVSDINTETGQGDAGTVSSSDAVLKILAEQSGREFKSIDEFKTHYSNLNKMVGDQSIAEQRKLADTYKRIANKIQPLAEKEGYDVETVLDYLVTDSVNKVKGEVSPDLNTYVTEKVESQKTAEYESKLTTLETKATRAEIKSEIGEQALKYLDDFTIWAKGKGLELDSNNFKKSPFMALVEADSKGSSILEPNSRPSQGQSSELNKAFAKAQASGNNDDWAYYLALKEKVGK